MALRGRIELVKAGMQRRGLLSRKLTVKNPNATGDVLLDEALKHIKDTQPPETLQTWIDYLSGKYIKLLDEGIVLRCTASVCLLFSLIITAALVVIFLQKILY